MLKRISLYPPLAFARVGGSPTPCDNFFWGPDDLQPGGTARTRIIPCETLDVAGDGAVTARALSESDTIVFKDEHGLRPVCPFFEIHGVWDEDGVEMTGPITPAVLARLELSARDLTWQIEIANLKAFHVTGAAGDRIVASLEIRGDETQRRQLEGRSPNDGKPLVPPDKFIPLGMVQATRPGGDLPEFRLRFTPPGGKPYAPRNFADRVANLRRPEEKDVIDSAEKALEKLIDGVPPEKVREDYALSLNRLWFPGFALPPEQCLLNPDAVWPHYNLLNYANLASQAKELVPRVADLLAVAGRGDRSEFIRALLGPYADVGNLPPGLFAFAAEPPNILGSLGLVDDMGDGTITVRIAGLEATSRVVIAPPSFAPDRRLPVSLADGLTDRVDRKRVRDEAWITGDQTSADKEVGDLLDRAYETAGLQNIDAVANFFREENSNRAKRRNSPMTPQQAADLLWDGAKIDSVNGLPLSAIALQRHRRNTSRLFFEIFARETRRWFERWIRPPADSQRFYDKRMPGLMRGFDRRPLHLTRRQYEALKAWAKGKQKS